jgi:hypothetical protein
MFAYTLHLFVPAATLVHERKAAGETELIYA